MSNFELFRNTVENFEVFRRGETRRPCSFLARKIALISVGISLMHSDVAYRIRPSLSTFFFVLFAYFSSLLDYMMGFFERCSVPRDVAISDTTCYIESGYPSCLR